MEHVVVYDKNRFPKQIASGLCRGCHKPVPPKRQAWCSNACVKMYHPADVARAVKNRDKGVCCACGFSISALCGKYRQEHPYPKYQDFMAETGQNQESFRRYTKAVKKWEKDLPSEEHDHIIPFSEGGKTVLENMRTLCSWCHKKRTATWHEGRKWKSLITLVAKPA